MGNWASPRHGKECNALIRPWFNKGRHWLRPEGKSPGKKEWETRLNDKPKRAEQPRSDSGEWGGGKRSYKNAKKAVNVIS